MLLGDNDSRVLLTPRIKPSQALYYQLSWFDIPSGQRHMADLTEFLKRERGISELCFAGLGFKGPFFSLLPPHALSALTSVRKYIDHFHLMASVWDLGHGTQHASMEVIWSQVKKQACWGEAKVYTMPS